MATLWPGEWPHSAVFLRHWRSVGRWCGGWSCMATILYGKLLSAAGSALYVEVGLPLCNAGADIIDMLNLVETTSENVC